MVIKKRGMFLLVLFLLVTSLTSMALDDKLVFYINADNDDCEDSDISIEYFGLCDVSTEDRSGARGRTTSYQDYTCLNDHLDVTSYPFDFTPSSLGCYAISYDSKAPEDPDHGYGFIKKGFILPARDDLSVQLPIPLNSITLSGDISWNHNLGGCSDSPFLSSNTVNPYICSSDSLWHPCSVDNINEEITIEEVQEDGSSLDKQYICGMKDDIYFRWFSPEQFVAEADNDGDLVPPPWDCNDDDATVHGSFQDISAHPEICGDKKNNDCQGSEVGHDGWWGDCNGNGYNCRYDPGPLGDSSDDCDTNKYACQNQRQVQNDAGVVSTEDAGTGGCVTSGEKCSWLDTSSTEGVCCGDDGLNELGATQLGTVGDVTTPQNFLCLNSNPNLVGYERESGDTTSLPPGWTNTIASCGTNWCWVNAIADPFKIMTINPLGQQPYDVVSDSKGWEK